MECTSCPTLNANTCPAPDAGTLFFTTTLFSTLLNSLCGVADTSDLYPQDPSGRLLESYDFIVVGGGTAGCTVAARLSENPRWNVLLIEAGGNPPSASEVPLLFVLLLNSNSPYNWNYTAEPTNACKASTHGLCNWARGKVLGGCGAHNANIYLRGTRYDYDIWAKLGNQGWSYDEVFPYFLKSEDQQSQEILSLPGANKYHNTEGELTVELPDVLNTVPEAYLKGIKRSGYPFLKDLNRERRLGYGIAQMTFRNGTRCSTAKAFLSPAKNRKNLHVLRNSKVTKILIDETTKTATGVSVTVGGRQLNITASKEVILSAGSMNSPQLLMLSGIGPKEHLIEKGIQPIIQDLKVGYNHLDHVSYYGLMYALEKSPDNIEFPDIIDAGYEYLKRKTGPFATIGFYSLVGFIRTKYGLPNKHEPDLEVENILLTNEISINNLALFVDLRNETVAVMGGLTQKNDIILPNVFVTRPKSAGRISLRSADPNDPPIIDPGYFTDERDMKTLLEGIKILVEIGNNIPGVKKVAGLPLRECDHLKPMSEEYFRCHISFYSTPAYHSSGTCRMGPRSDPRAVVDDQLRVHGVKGLRVADASIMPTITSVNTNGPTIMVAEKAADVIKNAWRGENKI